MRSQAPVSEENLESEGEGKIKYFYVTSIGLRSVFLAPVGANEGSGRDVTALHSMGPLIFISLSAEVAAAGCVSSSCLIPKV